MNSQPLDSDVIKQYWDTAKVYGIYEQKILNRIDYILRQIHSEFGSALKNWYFEDAAEGECGDLTKHLTGNVVWGYWVEATGCKEEMLILLDGKVWGLEEFPTRWLTEPFEQELKDGRRAYLEQHAKKKGAAQTAKKAKQAARQAALQKLTADERELLGLD